MGLTGIEMPELRLSHSRASTYSSCGMQYKLKYLDSFTEAPQGPLIAGQVVHKVIEVLEKEGLATDEDTFVLGGPAEQMFRLHFDEEVERAGGAENIRWGGRSSKAYPGGEDAEWWRLFGPGLVMGWHRVRQGDVELGWTLPPEYIEVEVTAVLPSGESFICYLDALVVTDDGEVIIRDYKTGRPYGGHKLQGSIYAWAVQSTLHLPVLGAECVYLRTPALDRIRFATSPLVDPVIDWMASVGKGIEAEIFPMNPGPFCMSCAVKAGCPYGQTLEEG